MAWSICQPEARFLNPYACAHQNISESAFELWVGRPDPAACEDKGQRLPLRRTCKRNKTGECAVIFDLAASVCCFDRHPTAERLLGSFSTQSHVTNEEMINLGCFGPGSPVGDIGLCIKEFPLVMLSSISQSSYRVVWAKFLVTPSSSEVVAFHSFSA